MHLNTSRHDGKRRQFSSKELAEKTLRRDLLTLLLLLLSMLQVEAAKLRLVGERGYTGRETRRVRLASRSVGPAPLPGLTPPACGLGIQPKASRGDGTWGPHHPAGPSLPLACVNYSKGLPWRAARPLRRARFCLLTPLFPTSSPLSLLIHQLRDLRRLFSRVRSLRV